MTQPCPHLTTQSRGPPWKHGIQASYHLARRSLILVVRFFNMKLLVKHHESLRILGFALLIISGVFLYFTIDWVFATLPNYGRVLIMLPFVCAAALTHAPTFANWNGANEACRMRAGGSLVVVALVLFGGICWLLFAPDSKT